MINKILLSIFIMISLPHADIFEKNASLGRGINMGNILEAPSEGAWGEHLDTSDFRVIAEKGFQSVRIPVKWSTEERTAIDSPYTVNETFFKRVDYAINAALNNNLNVVLNIHHYDTLFTKPTQEWNRFKAIWEQIASRYKNYSDKLYFEILNEPNTNLTPTLWNKLIAETFPIIRKSNPIRPVIIGVAEWGGVGALQKLVLPDDPNIILTVHYYNPFNFTHQGASWVENSDQYLGTKWNATYSDKMAVIGDLEYVVSYSKKHNVPVFMGEFGSIDLADEQSRYNWTSYCARLFESYGFSWSYWAFGTSFGAYDKSNKKWIDTIANALLSNDTSILALSTSDLGINIIRNGTFTDTSGWILGVWDTSGSATGSIKQNEYKVTILKEGAEPYMICLMQSNVPLVKNHSYALYFDIRADSERTIAAAIDQYIDTTYTNYGANWNVSVTTEKKTVIVPFTMSVTDSNARVVFNLGTQMPAVYISNVRLYDQGENTAVLHQKRISTSPHSIRSVSYLNGKGLIVNFKDHLTSDISINIIDLSGRVIYKSVKHISSSVKSITVPEIKKASSPLFLKITENGHHYSMLINFVK